MNHQGSFPPRVKLSGESVASTGLSVVYEPATDDPLIDIIMVHGLKGHPYKAWRYNQAHNRAEAQQKPEHQSGISKSNFPKKSDAGENFKAWVKGPSRENNQDSVFTGPNSTKNPISTENTSQTFWPADVLPDVCKKARIITFGYDTKVTKYTSGPTNMNNILSHGKDFWRERVQERPLIFLAHSLGGILVKEILALSSTAGTVALRETVKYTAAIIFLGTSHRGSPGLSTIGERSRTILNGMRLQKTAIILDNLRLENNDLQRAHEAFTRLWRQYNLRVKTFQEGFGLFGINLGVSGRKMVPDTSSMIGDPREHAETLQPNVFCVHREIGINEGGFTKHELYVKWMHCFCELFCQRLRPASGTFRSWITSFFALPTVVIYQKIPVNIPFTSNKKLEISFTERLKSYPPNALDDLDDAAERRQAELWRRLVHLPIFNCLRVGMSFRHFPHVSITGCVELELPNGGDILNYITHRFEARISPNDNDWKKELTTLINLNSQGVFLWVVLVLNKVLEQYDKGVSLESLKELIHDTPEELEDYMQSEKTVVTKMFQWAIAAARPLRLDE
ncbi:unnamed protein product [Fusarium venenatum]|uniref:DUF676 domain-containing protein n=1 Tax=Fusarium venenatum TaxID=56646 RepID=A0A2L2TAD1_9HYPO|nr:uncharacterized protein FVRRES_07981 [Fusarium venenatum]CEI67904.1 unnamed protein product [Fusarium venenatum]